MFYMSMGQCVTLFIFFNVLMVYGNVNVNLPGLSTAAAAMPTFDEFITMHHRSYRPRSAEYDTRRQLYELRVQEIESHNRKNDRMWTAGINIMSDRTKAEIAAFNGYRRAGHASLTTEASSFISIDPELGYDMPKDFSWESADINGDKKEEKVESLVNIRTQRCGNCWAASTNAMMEAHRQIHGGVIAKFDDDELTDCSENFFKCGGSGGCDGSTPELALMHYEKNGVLNTSSEKAAGQTCPQTRGDLVDKSELAPHEIRDGIREASSSSPARSFGMIGWEKLPTNQGWPIMLALYERGPVAVAVATDGWHQYSSGVYGGCSQDAIIGHSVLALGFGQVSHNGETVKYWRLQNSWGPSFGENGHFRLLRHDKDTDYCGNDNSPQDGVGCSGGPASVKVCGMCGVIYDAVVPYSAPETWLARQLQDRRNARKATEATATAGTRGGKRHIQNTIGVDDDRDGAGASGGQTAIPAEQTSIPGGFRLRLLIIGVFIILALAIGCYRFRTFSYNAQHNTENKQCRSFSNSFSFIGQSHQSAVSEQGQTA
jgi:cathepsin L